MSEKIPTGDTSFLGSSPTCDICGKYIVAGDIVNQEFTGTVTLDSYAEELCIVECVYTLVHVTCNKAS